MNTPDIDPADVDSGSTTQSSASAPLQMATAAPPILRLSQLQPGDFQYEGDSETEAKYGGGINQLEAGLEGIARGVSLGTSDLAETRLLGVKPEDIKARAEANPVTSFAGNVAGGAGLAYLTGGLGLGAIGGLAEATGTGAIFGAGNAVSDYALGDPNENASKIIAHTGMSIVTGAATGLGIGILLKGIAALPSLWRKAPIEAAEAGANVPGEPGAPPPPPGDTAPIIDAPVTDADLNNYDALEKKYRDAEKFGGDAASMPQKADVLEAEARLMASADPLEYGMTDAQKFSLDSQTKKNAYNVLRLSDTKGGDLTRVIESVQKSERLAKLDTAIDSIAPEAKLAKSFSDAGEDARNVLRDKIESVNDTLGPQYAQLDMVPLEEGNHLQGTVDAITSKVPQAAQMFDNSKPGINIKDYSPKWGLDKAAYDRVAETIDLMKKDPPETVGDLLNFRRYVSPPGEKAASDQLYAIKSGMLDYINKVAPVDAREILKNFAINYEQAKVINKSFGAAIGDESFKQISGAVPEKVLGKIFSNSTTVNAAKNILKDKPGAFDKMLADWINLNKQKMSPEGAFSSTNYLKFLKGEALDAAFADKPATLQRMRDLALTTRHIPDAVSGNPSGSAATVWGIGKELMKGHEGIQSMALDFLKEKAANWDSKRTFNALQQGKADQISKLQSIKNVIGGVGEKISASAKGIFNSPTGRAAAISGATLLSDKSYNDHVQKIKELTSNPQNMFDHISQNIMPLHDAAPNISQGLSTAMVNGIQFLNSKIPSPGNQMYLSHEWKPTSAQKLRFSNYFNAVNDPVSVMSQVKDHSITNDSVEALSAVHPKLLQEMRMKVFEHMKQEKAKDMSYAAKAAISKFLGEPLDSNMLPASIMSNQTMFNIPEQGQQAAPKQGRKTALGPMKQVKVASRTAPRSTQEEEST